MKKIYIIITALCLIGLVGCSSEQGKEHENQLNIYTTVYPLQYIAERIGSEYVHVETIYPPGADEHTYEPTQKEMMRLAKSDSLFYIGLGLEGFVDKMTATLKQEDVGLYAVGETLSIEESESHDDGHGHEHDYDPHVWLDPVLMEDMSKVIFDVLKEKLPEETSTLEENYVELIQDLQQLDQSFKAVMEESKHKEIIVSHAAYGYWENRYGIEQIAIAGKSSTSEPSQKKLQEIIQLIKNEKLQYVLYEQNTNPKLTDVVKHETGVESLTLHNLSVLTDEDIKHNKDYLLLMNENIETLHKALN